jgi:hypothetical protein
MLKEKGDLFQTGRDEFELPQEKPSHLAAVITSICY